MPFAEDLKKARESAGLTITRAAELFEVSPRLWSYWEAGTYAPPKEAEAVTQERLLAKLKLHG